MKRRDLRLVELTCDAQRVQTGSPKRLVRVDVSHARQPSLIEQRRLDGGSPALECLGESLARKRAQKGLAADALREVRLEVLLLDQLPGSEAAHVPIVDVRSVV
jgi:hypothetical protein